jgi:hypothetical protein
MREISEDAHKESCDQVFLDCKGPNFILISIRQS